MINTGASSNLSDSSFNNNAYFSNELSAIIDNANIGIWEVRFPAKTASYSRQYEKILGYDEGEFSRRNEVWENLVMPEDFDWVQQSMDEYLAGKSASYKTQYRILRKDGSFIWVRDQAFIMERDAQGKPTRVLGIIEDITHLKSSEERIKEQKDQIDFISKIASLSYWELDIDKGIIFSKGYWITGSEIAVSKEKAQSLQAWFDAIHHEDKERINRAFSSLLTGETDYFNEEIRFCAATNPDAYFWSQVVIQIVDWGEKGRPTRALGATIDVNKLKRAEEQIHAALIQKEYYNKRLKTDIDAAMKTLEETKEFNQLLLDSNPEMSLVFNNKFQLIDCNPATLELFGYSSKDEIIKDGASIIARCIPERQADGRLSIPLAERLISVVQTGSLDFETELVVRGKSHSLRVIFKKVPYKGAFVLVCFGLDLTLVKETKRELVHQDKLLRIINEEASRIVMTESAYFDDVVWEFLQNIGRGVEVNRIVIWKNCINEDNRLCAEAIFEWFEGVPPYTDRQSRSKVDYLKEAPTWYFAARENRYINQITDDYSPKERPRFEKRGAKSTLGIPIYFKSEFWGFVSFDDSIAKRVFSQQEISILHSAAILLVAAILKNETTLNLMKSREEAISASKAKTDFLSRMSHEIRTPMNAIIGMTTIAKKATDTNRLQYCLDRIDMASKQLLGLINDILDMSKIEANKLEIVAKEFDFEKMIQNTITVMRVKFEEKHQKLVVDFDSLFTRAIVGDELRFSQVLLNLLSNANKFTPEHGTIAIKIIHTPIDDTHVNLHVEVSDNGIGISPEQQDKLFQSFEQADNSITRKFGGTGLGLALCKKILQLMDGDIWIESEFGKGTTFIFELALPYGADSLQETTLKPSGIKALVIDDSQDALEYFAHILSTFSIPCDTALSGAKGIELAKKNYESGDAYNIVFVDWQLPNGNGADVSHEIQLIDKNAALVLMSVADWPDIEKSISPEITIEHFLQKPALPSTVYDTIVNLLNHKGIAEQKTPVNVDLTGKLEGKRLLVVEDIEINQEILSSILEETLASLEFANNGIQAVDKFKEKGEQYDLILMDMQMPELDGLGATEQIRALGTDIAANIPIIAMTANAFNEDINACLAAGMNGHLAKPIDVSELMRTLARYLRR
ncbi:MAG: PAS domain-containing protein [Treponema sp.]|jgi:PAS domain S-box-containing protein|nr:PAS domain-containing protein [Treponema sp.]